MSRHYACVLCSTSVLLLSFLFLLVSFPAASSFSSSSVPRCVPYTGTLCTPFITQNQTVELPINSTSVALSENLLAATGFSTLFWQVNTNCSNNVMRLICNQLFPSCLFSDSNSSLNANANSSQPYSIVLPSIDICMSVPETCGGFMSFLVGAEGLYLDLSKDANVVNLVLAQPSVFGPTNAGTILAGACAYVFDPNTFQPFFNSSLHLNINQTEEQIQIQKENPYQWARCEPFNSSLIAELTLPAWPSDQGPFEDVPRSYCENVIVEGANIYVPFGSSLLSLNEDARQAAWSFGLTPLAFNCSINYAKYICSQIFMPCHSDALTFYYNDTSMHLQANTLKTAFPSFPCRSLCYEMNSTCASFVAQMYADVNANPNATAADLSGLPNCFNLNEQLEQPFFPDVYTYFGDFSLPVIPLTVNISLSAMPLVATTVCNDMSNVRNLTADRVPIVCPQKTVSVFETDQYGRSGNPNSPNRLQGATCALTCPGEFFDPYYQNIAVWMYKTLRILNFVIGFFMALSWILFQKFKSQRAVRGMFISMCINDFASIITWFTGYPKITCANATDTWVIFQAGAADGSFACSLQAIVSIFASSMIVMFWILLSVEITMGVVFEYRIPKQYERHYNVITKLFAIGYPLIGVIVSMTFNDGQMMIGSSSGIAICFPYADAVYWAFTNGPGLVGIGACLFSSPFVLYKIWHVLGKASKKRNKRCCFWFFISEKMHIFWNSFLFNVLSIITVGYVIFFSLTTNPEYNDSYVESFTDWITCYVKTLPTQVYVYGNWHYRCGNRPSNQYPTAWYFLMGLVTAIGTGLIMLVVFGFPWVEWKIMFGKYWQGSNCATGKPGVDVLSMVTIPTGATPSDLNRIKSPTNAGNAAGMFPPNPNRGSLPLRDKRTSMDGLFMLDPQNNINGNNANFNLNAQSERNESTEGNERKMPEISPAMNNGNQSDSPDGFVVSDENSRDAKNNNNHSLTVPTNTPGAFSKAKVRVAPMRITLHNNKRHLQKEQEYQNEGAEAEREGEVGPSTPLLMGRGFSSNDEITPINEENDGSSSTSPDGPYYVRSPAPLSPHYPDAPAFSDSPLPSIGNLPNLIQTPLPGNEAETSAFQSMQDTEQEQQREKEKEKEGTLKMVKLKEQDQKQWEPYTRPKTANVFEGWTNNFPKPSLHISVNASSQDTNVSNIGTSYYQNQIFSGNSRPYEADPSRYGDDKKNPTSVLESDLEHLEPSSFR